VSSSREGVVVVGVGLGVAKSNVVVAHLLFRCEREREREREREMEMKMKMQCRLMNEDEKEGVNERIQALEYELNQRVHEELELVRAIMCLVNEKPADRSIE